MSNEQFTAGKYPYLRVDDGLLEAHRQNLSILETRVPLPHLRDVLRDALWQYPLVDN